MSYSRMPRFPTVNKAKIAVVVIIAIIIIVISTQSVATVQAGYRGVVLRLGAVQDRVLGEGLHFITPFTEQVVQMEVRTQKFQADSSAASKDLQEVRTTIALNYRIDPQQTNKIYQLLGANYQDRVISPTIQES
ncbi:MAG TPA: SPFH domain-containing protein, partial [Nitrososphaeraceae archaeon]|nr:SPFH domain-containing protein [Nitrososphaeraceae archaeon]